ncbi:MAG: TonB-dependent receptor [Bacteroidota bacterium]|nr:TonB-dependent receptor [Bacteroidota bacterium]
MTRFCQFVLLLLLVPTVAAQQSFTINGTVRDAETGETLPYANVFIMQTSQGATTNVDGNFVLLGVEPGKYELRISYLGYNDTFLEIDTANLDGPLDIGINQVSTYLDEVLVTAERFRMMQAGQAVSKVTISPRDAAMLPSIGEVDLFRSLQLLPGISGTNEGSSGLFVRGGTPDQTLVLLDGMTVYHVDHFFGFFSAFNADAIKDVQVYKGGFPASYGGRTSSVVELTGLSGSNDFGVGVGLNLLSAQVAAEVPLGQRASLMVAGRRSYTDVLRTGVYNSIYDTLTGADPTATRGGQGPGGGFGSAGLLLLRC